MLKKLISLLLVLLLIFTLGACGEKETGDCTFDNGAVTKEPTHFEEGIKTYTCTVCGVTKTETIAKLTTHTYGNWTKVNDTTHKHTCTICGKEESASHSWNSGVITKQPTKEAEGVKTYTCSICNDVRHNQLTDATGHSYGAWYIAKEATFENTGIERRDCKNCDKYETKEIPVKRHVDKDIDRVCDVCGNKFCETHTEELLPATNATCNQDGLTEGKKCAHCDAVLRAQEVIPAIGHNFGQWMQAETPGVEKRVCDGCGESEQRTASSLTEPSPTEPSSTQPATQIDSCDADDPVDPIVIVLIVAGAVAVAGGAAVILRKNK